MARSDLSERMQHHLDASESVVARQEVATIRQEEMVGHHLQVVERQENQAGDLLTELREQGLRQEKILRGILDLLGAQTEMTREILAEIREMRAEISEMREESHAQRQALFAILDRMPPPEAD